MSSAPVVPAPRAETPLSISRSGGTIELGCSSCGTTTELACDEARIQEAVPAFFAHHPHHCRPAL